MGTFTEMPIEFQQLVSLPLWTGSTLGLGFGLSALIGLLPAAAIIGAGTGLLSHMEKHFRRGVA
ncbi:hypothetical protein SD80_012260 [Scytonema tolypothrichoides VB-61278]|nr:hypothetical protein SD80_012260 [Scytonema tolypothrichoides VB-61278]